MIFTHFTPETDPASIPRNVDVLVLVSRTNNSGNPVHSWQQARYFGQYSLDADTDDDTGWAEEGPNESGMYAPEGFYVLSPDEEQYRALVPEYTIHGWLSLPPAVVPQPVEWEERLAGTELQSTNTDRFLYRIRLFGGGSIMEAKKQDSPLFLLMPREFGPNEPMAAGTLEQMQKIATMDHFMYSIYQASL
jgi:hypothetical protein